jgi:hypothetical protein
MSLVIATSTETQYSNVMSISQLQFVNYYRAQGWAYAPFPRVLVAGNAFLLLLLNECTSYYANELFCSAGEPAFKLYSQSVYNNFMHVRRS